MKGVVGQNLCQVHVVLAYGNSLEVIGWFFQNSYRMMWAMKLEWNFGSMWWSGDCTLKEAFPEFYYISKARESSIAEVMCFFVGRIHWDAQFCRPMHDWELESLVFFMNIVYSSSVLGIVPNQVCWKPAKSRDFEVWGYYHSLSPYFCIFSMENDVAIEGFSKDSFFFSCSASLDKITTTGNLQKKQIIVVDWCYVCKRCGELVDHFLFIAL